MQASQLKEGEMDKFISISLTDTGDNYPIYYKVSSQTTKGITAGWHLVELLDETFKMEVSNVMQC